MQAICTAKHKERLIKEEILYSGQRIKQFSTINLIKVHVIQFGILLHFSIQNFS